MKCNINGSINDSMVRAYGKEFDLSDAEIINTIAKVRNLDVGNPDFNPKDVEVALFNYDYYVRPGVAKETFKRKWEQGYFVAKMSRNKGIDELVYMTYITHTLEVIKQAFDEEYFKEQIARRRRSSLPCSKDKLRTYLNKFDEEQLKIFFYLMVFCRREHGLFISEPSSAALWNEIREACQAAGCNISAELKDARDRSSGVRDGFYFFKWLSKKRIVAMLFDAINLDTALAGSIAKKLYDCGDMATVDYLNRKLDER